MRYIPHIFILICTLLGFIVIQPCHTPEKKSVSPLFRAELPVIPRLLRELNESLNSDKPDRRMLKTNVELFDTFEELQEVKQHCSDQEVEQQSSMLRAKIRECVGTRLVTDKRETLLHRAIRQNEEEIVAALLAEGIDPNYPLLNGRTPLHEAALRGFSKIVKRLLDKKADPNAFDHSGRTPLHEASGRSVTTVLLQCGAIIDIVDPKGNTPLHLALFYNDEGKFQCLMEAGANDRIPNMRRVTVAKSRNSVLLKFKKIKYKRRRDQKALKRAKSVSDLQDLLQSSLRSPRPSLQKSPR